jgi:Effector protein
MAAVTKKLPEFPGFATRYDPSDRPYFESSVLEQLRLIAGVPLGKKLLEDIAAARPLYRTPSASKRADVLACEFYDGVNVVFIPTTMTSTQSGYKMKLIQDDKYEMVSSDAPQHNTPGCPWTIAGGSNAEAACIEGDNDGKGCVSVMRFTNAQVVTSKGETTYPHIVLAHELIHSYHHVTGTKKENGEEEWTTGVAPFVDEPMTENKFREAFGIKLREQY